MWSRKRPTRTSGRQKQREATGGNGHEAENRTTRTNFIFLGYLFCSCASYGVATARHSAATTTNPCPFLGACVRDRCVLCDGVSDRNGHHTYDFCMASGDIVLRRNATRNSTGPFGNPALLNPVLEEPDH